MTNRQTNRSTIRPTNQLTNRPGHREVTLPIMIKNTFQNENYHHSVVSSIKSRVENVLMSHDGWANGWMYNWYGARLSQIGGNFKSFNNYNK